MQIAFADRILLNKCDLVTAEDAEALTTRIRTINTLAPIQQCERCAVELSWILDVHAFDPQKAKELEQSLTPMFDGPDGTPGLIGQFQNLLPIADGLGDGRRLTPKHDQSVRTVALEIAGKALDSSKVESWLAGLLWEDGDEEQQGAGKTELFRIKGVIWVHGYARTRRAPKSNPLFLLLSGYSCATCVVVLSGASCGGRSERKWVIQAVHEIFEVVESDHVWDAAESPEAERTSKVVVIGRRLDQAALQRGVEGCFPD